MALRTFGAATATAVALALATPAYAVTEIQWWHAMTGPNNDVVVKLANDFNASQSDYKIVPTFKGSYADTLNAGIAAFRAGLAQRGSLADNGEPDGPVPTSGGEATR